jgi:hypothetical protein
VLPQLRSSALRRYVCMKSSRYNYKYLRQNTAMASLFTPTDAQVKLDSTYSCESTSQPNSQCRQPFLPDQKARCTSWENVYFWGKPPFGRLVRP